MDLSLDEKTKRTKITVSLKNYPMYKKYIQSLITLYGGRETKRNTKFVHFEIDEDLLNKK